MSWHCRGVLKPASAWEQLGRVSGFLSCHRVAGCQHQRRLARAVAPYVCDSPRMVFHASGCRPDDEVVRAAPICDRSVEAPGQSAGAAGRSRSVFTNWLK